FRFPRVARFAPPNRVEIDNKHKAMVVLILRNIAAAPKLLGFAGERHGNVVGRTRAGRTKGPGASPQRFFNATIAEWFDPPGVASLAVLAAGRPAESAETVRYDR